MKKIVAVILIASALLVVNTSQAHDRDHKGFAHEVVKKAQVPGSDVVSFEAIHEAYFTLERPVTKTITIVAVNVSVSKTFRSITPNAHAPPNSKYRS